MSAAGLVFPAERQLEEAVAPRGGMQLNDPAREGRAAGRAQAPAPGGGEKESGREGVSALAALGVPAVAGCTGFLDLLRLNGLDLVEVGRVGFTQHKS